MVYYSKGKDKDMNLCKDCLYEKSDHYSIPAAFVRLLSL